MKKVHKRLPSKQMKYWRQHAHNAVRFTIVGLAIVGAIITSAVKGTPVHTVAATHKPVHVATAQKTAPKQPAPKPTPAPAPTPKPTPAPAVTAAPPPPAPAPKPIATTQPSPGTGVKQLSPTPSAPPASPTTTSSSTTSSSTSTSTPTTSTSSGAPAAATGGYYSTNWAGYAAMTGKFTSVSGSWTVPTISSSSASSSGDASWIGIGGVNTNDLIQTGTDDTVNADGSVTSYAFYELLPASALEITAMKVSVGDVMSAAITETTPSQWTISIQDVTTGKSYSTSVSYTSTYSSAEWIEEDPSYTNGSLIPFDDFGHIIFTSGSTTMNGTASTLAASSAQPLTLVDSKNNPLATPSVLTDGGSGFWVTRN